MTVVAVGQGGEMLCVRLDSGGAAWVKAGDVDPLIPQESEAAE